MTYASSGDVLTILGKIGPRLPIDVNVDALIGMAHAELVDRLAETYPSGIPTFEGDGLDAVRWAEAKLAAAEILEVVRVNLPEIGEAPDQLRASVDRTLSLGIVGYPPGSVDTPDGDGGSVPANAGPQVSSFTPASMFPDPYADLRGVTGFLDRL